jgi:hypothetical protein
MAVESLFSLDRSGDGFAVGGDNISGNVVWSVFSFRSFAKGWKAFCFPSPALLVMVDFLSGMAASSSRGEISGHLLVMGVLGFRGLGFWLYASSSLRCFRVGRAGAFVVMIQSAVATMR